MRKLVTKDVFALGRIVKKAKLKEKLAEITFANQKNTDEEQLDKELDKAFAEAEAKRVGVQMVFSIIEACCEKNVESELYAFLASVFEMKSAKEVENLELDKLIANIAELAEKNNLMHFLSLATQSM